MNVRTPDQETALAAFIEAAQSDDDYGYPHGAVFIAADQLVDDGELVWRSLHEGSAAILIRDDGAEMLIAPVRLGLVRRLSDRLRRRMPVAVAYRPRPITAATASVQYGTTLRAEIKRDSLFSNDPAFACL